MDGLFFSALLVAIAEGIVQYLWVPMYFKVGIPVLVAGIPDAANEAAEHPEVVRLMLGGDGHSMLVRQHRYGVARYACFHGFVQLVDQANGARPKCILFVDWNVLLVGAFVSCAIATPSLAAALLGMLLAILLSAVVVAVNRDRILNGCARSIAQSKAGLA